jgi:hypothetical protein
LDSPTASDLYFKVAPIAIMVKEYMTVMEKSPLLVAAALDEEFRRLAEFNGAVLAGRETQYGYKFVTWERDYCQRRYDFADIRRLKNAGKQR